MPVHSKDKSLSSRGSLVLKSTQKRVQLWSRGVRLPFKLAAELDNSIHVVLVLKALKMRD